MTTEELKQKAEEKYCKNCKIRQEQCLWAWRNTNGLDMPNNQNCSCKEVPAYIAGATEVTKELQEQNEILAKHILELQKTNGALTDRVNELEKEGNRRCTIISGQARKIKELTDEYRQAKEIIRTFLNMPMPNNEEVFADVGTFLSKAEAFLKGVKL